MDKTPVAQHHYVLLGALINIPSRVVVGAAFYILTRNLTDEKTDAEK